MKAAHFQYLSHILLLTILVFIPGEKIIAQTFQRAYGDNLDNSFTKVIRDGSFYYVLGQHEFIDGAPPTATVTRLDANGVHQWTITSDVPSVFNDAILIPGGDLLIVGWTLPFDATNESIIGRVTSAGGGNFAWLRRYDVPGREGLTRIVENPVPQNINFPFYTIGFQHQPGGSATVDDIALFNLNDNGSFNWKKIYPSADDQEFMRDLEVLGNGDMLMAGNNASGVIYQSDNAGIISNGVTDIPIVADIEIAASGEIYAAANSPNVEAHVIKLGSTLGPLWDVEIPQLTSVSQIWEGSPGELYVTGRGIFGGIDRAVIVKIDENLPSGIWIKYLNTGTSFSAGSSWLMPGGNVAFTDARIIPGGFGQTESFISISDLELTTCNVSETIVDLSAVTLFPASPEPPVAEFQDPQGAVEIINYLALNWEQQTVCEIDTCSVDFEFEIDCDVVTFTDLSDVPNPTWEWSFQGGDPGVSMNQHPIVSFPSCGTYEVCLTVTGGTKSDPCELTICKDIIITDNTPPVAACKDITAALDGSCQVVITSEMIDDGSSDDCRIQSIDIQPDILTGCGEHNVTLTVTDWCGNTSSCIAAVQTIDNTPPTISCPANLTITALTWEPCSIAVHNIAPSNVTSHCGASTVTYFIFGSTFGAGQDDASGVVFNQGFSTVTYTISDGCGNISTCSFSVTVLCDTQPTFFKCGTAIVTQFSGVLTGTQQPDPNGSVLTLVDTRNHATAPLGINWYDVTSSPTGLIQLNGWQSKNMGQLFGLTIDNNSNVYAASSTVYGRQITPPLVGPDFGNVYKVDAASGNVSLFAALPQNGFFPAGLGDVWFDEQHNQIIVSNFHDGLIYRYDLAGLLLGTYDFPGLTIGIPSQGFIARGERVWAVATHNGRLYFSVWNEDRTRHLPIIKNQIWSVQLDPSGVPLAGTEIVEKNLPDLIVNTPSGPVVEDYSSPVSDISFSENGIMLIAERTMDHDFGDAVNNTGLQPNASRVMELSGVNWATEKIFYVGNANSNTNSSGGIDYGYESFDPSFSAQPMLCDSVVWATGDALRSPGFNNIPDNSPLPWGSTTIDRVYGLAGMPQTGNSNLPVPASDYVKNSSIYIDLDNEICFNENYRIGDVAIFKNCIDCPVPPPVPCDSLMVMIEPDPQNACCYVVDIKNLAGPNISKLNIELLTPGVIFNTSQINVLAGFQYAASNSDHTLCITHTSGSIPEGMLNDVIRFCYSGVDAPGEFPQTIEFTWLQNFGGSDIPTACVETFTTDCAPIPPQDTCVAITPVEVHCNPSNVYEYVLTFKVTNLSTTPAFNAYTINLYGLPAGFSFSPCLGNTVLLNNISISIPGAPLAVGQTSGNVCVKIVSSTPILSPVSICAQAKLIGIEACCTTDEIFCFVIQPCCDPCGEISITTSEIEPDTACCYSLAITNNCPYPYFTKIEAEIITPGVTYGYYALNSSYIGFWTIANSTTTKLCLSPNNNGTIPGGSLDDLASFCLDNITGNNQVPQQIIVRWITTGHNGQDSIACDTMLEFNCEPTVHYECLTVEDLGIECLPDDDKYQLTFTVTNHSAIPFTATSLDLILLAPSDLIFFPSSSIPLNPPLSGGQSQTVTIELLDTDGLPGSGNLSFIPKLSFMAADTCCYEGMPVNVSLPPCDTCACGTYSGMVIRWGQGLSQQVSCGNNAVTLGCPTSGGGYNFTGVFRCQGESCSNDAPITWTLNGPGISVGGNTIANPYFGIGLLPNYFVQPGLYTLTLNGQCGSQNCSCIIQFIVNCPNLCPCTSQDIQNLFIAVNKGFSQVLWPASCEACFTPKGLSDCEVVQWHLNSPGGMQLGTSNGNQTFCYIFPGPGTYNVFMVVMRKRPDGSTCQTFVRSQIVQVSCFGGLECNDSVLSNPSFREGAAAGELDSGGRSDGWKKMEPSQAKTEVSKREGSFDGWTIDLSGNLETNGVLTRMEPVCLERDSGLITVRIAVSDSGVQVAKKAEGRPCDKLSMRLFRGEITDVSECNEVDCYQLAAIDLSALDTGWHELQIPYNLTEWIAQDICGEFQGLLVRPAIFVTNGLGNDQGGEDTYSFAQLDNFCFGGTLVAIEEQEADNGIRIYPNPTTGELKIDFIGNPLNESTIQIVDLYGRILKVNNIYAGEQSHNFSIATLPEGVYFVKITSEGLPVLMEKIVKQ